MLVIKATPRLLSFIVTISAVIIFCYFVLLGPIAAPRRDNHKRQSGQDKKIIAYSLRKQIEIESKEFRCNREELSVEGEGRSEDEAWSKIEDLNLYVYSFYYDRRLHPYRYLRIIAMIKGAWTHPLFCQILSSKGHYHIIKATTTEIWSKTWNQNDTNIYYSPFLVSCHVPLNSSPVHLSLNDQPCRLNRRKFNISSTTAPKENQNFFTICVKPLNFNADISGHLLQWIAINQVLGAEAIEFYVEDLPEKTVNFLENLERQLNGSIILHRHRKIDFTQVRSVWQKRRYELIAYNDCLYRNIHTSHFIVPIDVDEIIIPRRVSTWAELLHATLSKGEDNFASYSVRNAYYLRRFNVGQKKSSKIFFFGDVVRSEFSDEGESGKSFVSTKNTLTVFNHYALEVLRPGVGRNRFLETDLVQMNHYKDDCSVVILPECAKYLSSPVRIVDDVVFKYKRRFYEQYAKLLALSGRAL